MSSPLEPVLPFILAAARSLTLGIQSPGSLERQPVSDETESESLATVAFCLLGFLVTLILIFRFPDFGAVIAEYNQF